MTLDKRRLMATLLGQLRNDLAIATAAQQDAQSGATHAEAKPENDKDTRATEASYLARGQAQRVRDLESELSRLEGLGTPDFSGGRPIGLGAAVKLETAGAARWYLLSPAGAGMTIEESGESVRVISPKGPLGRGLLGCAVGDELEVESPLGLRSYALLDAC